MFMKFIQRGNNRATEALEIVSSGVFTISATIQEHVLTIERRNTTAYLIGTEPGTWF